MNKKYILSALLCAAAVSFTSCVEENLENITPAQVGDEIVFGARAGFENAGPETKTLYYEGEPYTVDGKKFQRIDWVDGEDMVEIYCEESSGDKRAHYVLNNLKDADQKADYAYLTRYGDAGLQWGEGTHTFYAMYPSSLMFKGNDDQANTLNQGTKMEGSTLKGHIPVAQSPISITKDDAGNYVAKPDMRYAYMAAKTTVTRENPEVAMSFVPVATAVQIELQMPERVTGEGLSGDPKPVSFTEIQVQGAGVAGDFTADLGEGWTGTYPDCANVGDGFGNIQISVAYDGKPIELTKNQTLTFTVFLRPGADVSKLTVRISPNGSSYLGKTLTGITIPAKKKTVITNLMLPSDGIAINAESWMDQLDPQMEFKKLSIPGSGGTFSYNYTGSNADRYKQQVISFEDQWKAGIRAFEIVSDRPSSSNTSLGSQNVKCNKTSVGVTVNEVLTMLLNKVSTEAGAKECAVLILTYQPEGASPQRDAAAYAGSLKAMYNALTAAQKEKIIVYHPQITLKEAQGHVMLFCRINQRDEKDGSSASQTQYDNQFNSAVNTLKEANVPCVLINGCGTGKDKWGARGYTIDGNRAPDISNSYSSFGYSAYIEQFMEDGYINPSNQSRVKKGNMQFGYATNYDNVTCWYQEWARVVPQNMKATITSWFGLSSETYYWSESYTEKLDNATETFEMAISDDYKNYIFFNSLSGYLTSTSIEGSVTPSTGSTYGGAEGDIKGLADRINPDFYSYVRNSGMEQTTGPTGIVMMDYVKLTPDSDTDGGFYLPGAIIANNFKFTSTGQN